MRTDGDPCRRDADCPDAGRSASNGAQIEDPPTGELALRSATVTDLTLIPCTQDFENGMPSEVTVQFEIYQRVRAASLGQHDGHLLEELLPVPGRQPERSRRLGLLLRDPWHDGGSHAHHARIRMTAAVIGVAGVTRADAQGNLTRAALNIHMEGDRFSASDGEVIDRITLPDIF